MAILKIIFLVIISVGCSKFGRKAKIGSKLRSTGNGLALVDIEQVLQPGFVLQGNTMTANSSFNLETYKVPVSRINLVTGLKGTAYSSASPDIYQCAGASDGECLVDLTQAITVDDVLRGNPGEEEVEVSQESQTYEGIAVEFCHSSREFSAIIKGSVTLGSTTYYTHAVDGLSTAAPAQEISIKISGGGCGVTTTLLEPVTVEPDSEIKVVLYADPTGAVFATDQKVLANSNCLGSDSLAVCAGYVAVFGTVDNATPTVERYQLETDGGYSDVITTIVLTSSDVPFGAYMRDLYTNKLEKKTLHSALSFSGISVRSWEYQNRR